MIAGRAGAARGRAARLLVGVALLAATGACELYTSVDPDDVGAIALDTVPFPAVALNDSLRNEAGTVAPLRARVFDAAGNLLPQATVRWRALDSSVVVDPATGVVRGRSLTATAGARVIAEADSLQSQPVTLFVVRAPTTLSTTMGDTAIRFQVGSPTDVNQLAIPVRVTSRVATADSGVRGWVVRYAIVGSTPAFVDSLRLATTVPGTGPERALTDAAGLATRALRVFVPLNRQPDPVRDTATVVVQATATYRGQPLAGSPVRVRVRLRPRS